MSKVGHEHPPTPLEVFYYCCRGSVQRQTQTPGPSVQTTGDMSESPTEFSGTPVQFSLPETGPAQDPENAPVCFA